jgi:hypothetical protein
MAAARDGTPWAAEIAAELGIPCAPNARKPLPSFFAG